MDISISLVAIIILIPFWLLLALCIFLEDRGHPFYKQERLGKDEKIITIRKFRSMRVNNIPPLQLGAVKHNHALVTRIGYFIRRFKLDETPQFINVLMGEMSLVGPRPPLPGRLPTMSEVEKKRFHVLPGLSGWAEVNGNVELAWEEQLLLDLWYVEHWSFKLDCKIIIRTFLVVFLGSHRNEIALDNAKKFVK